MKEKFILFALLLTTAQVSIAKRLPAPLASEHINVSAESVVRVIETGLIITYAPLCADVDVLPLLRYFYVQVLEPMALINAKKRFKKRQRTMPNISRRFYESNSKSTGPVA